MFYIVFLLLDGEVFGGEAGEIFESIFFVEILQVPIELPTDKRAFAFLRFGRFNVSGLG